MARLAVFLALICLPSASAYSEGAPESACATMIPGHGPEAQGLSTTPYTIIVASGETNGGGSVNVTIKGATNDDKFKGFAVVAENGAGEKIGTLKPALEFQQQFVASICDGKVITHKKNWATRPWHELGLVWEAPENFLGEVTIYATVVKTKPMFWVRLPGTQTVTVRGGAAEETVDETNEEAGAEGETGENKAENADAAGSENESGVTTDDTGNAEEQDTVEEVTETVATTDETEKEQSGEEETASSNSENLPRSAGFMNEYSFMLQTAGVVTVVTLLAYKLS